MLGRGIALLSCALLLSGGMTAKVGTDYAAGALVASVATSGSDNTGPADLIPLDEPTARTTLAELQLAD